MVEILIWYVVCTVQMFRIQMYTITIIYCQFTQHIENIIKLGDFFQCVIIELLFGTVGSLASLSRYSSSFCRCGESYPLQSTGASTHDTQAAPYIHARRNQLLFADRQRGIFRLHVGCANTQWTSAIFSPFPQGPGQDEWYATTKSEMTAGNAPGSLDHESQPFTIRPFLTPYTQKTPLSTCILSKLIRLTH